MPGLVVFVVPLFTTSYHTVVVQATIVTMFIVPVVTLAYITPMVSQTEFALSSIEAMTDRLRAASGEVPDESAQALAPTPSSIALREATFIACG